MHRRPELRCDEWMRSVLGQVLSWWAQQMRDLLPRRLRELRSRGAALMLYADTNGGIAIVLRRHGHEHALGHVTAGQEALAAMLPRRQPATVRLCLPASQLLEREVTLPLAVERDLAQVLRYEMDRLTPFTPDAVFWAARIAGRDHAAGRLTIQLAMVPRVGLQPLLDRLAQSGLRPAMIGAASAFGTPWRIALDDRAPRTARARRAARAVMAGSAAGLVLAVAVLPFARQEVALAAWNARIAALRPRAAEAAALRRRIADHAAGAEAIAAESARLVNASQAIATLTAILPDDSYLTSLGLQQRQLTLTGESTAAARLIGALAANRHVGNPRFTAPIIRSGNAGSDQFSIRAEWRP